MDSKRFIFGLMLILMSATGIAADTDNTKPSTPEGKSSLSDGPSYFQGVWAGKWPWGAFGVELTITVGEKNRKGYFPATYSWESGQRKNGTVINPGTIKAWGKEVGDKFLIEWKNKQGVKSSITLTKKKEDLVTAIYDTGGTFTGSTMADMETYLQRK